MDGFSVRFSLESLSLFGLTAIDWRRQHGLPDGPNIYTSQSPLMFPITDEAFLRTWFQPDEITTEAMIRADWLCRNEMCLHGGGECVEISKDLPEARVQQLFIRAKFAAMGTDLKGTKLQLAVAQALLSKEDQED